MSHLSTRGFPARATFTLRLPGFIPAGRLTRGLAILSQSRFQALKSLLEFTKLRFEQEAIGAGGV